MTEQMKVYANVRLRPEHAKGLAKILHLAGLDKVPFRKIYRSPNVRVDYNIFQYIGEKMIEIYLSATNKESYELIRDNLKAQFEEIGIKLNLNEREQKW